MRQVALLTILTTLALAGLACTMAAGVESTPAPAPTALPDAPTATLPPVPSPQATGVGGPNPTLGATYVDEVAGYAFDYPANWYVNGTQGIVLYLTSFEMSEPGGGGIPEGSTKMDFLPWDRPEAPPRTLDDFMALVDQERAGSTDSGALVEEVRWELAGGIPAVRRIYDDVVMAGRVAALYTIIDGEPLRVIGYGDLTRFDEIARTVRPAGQ